MQKKFIIGLAAFALASGLARCRADARINWGMLRLAPGAPRSEPVLSSLLKGSLAPVAKSY